MARVSALTPRQEAILRWIGDSMPAGVMKDDSHRISAAALRSRGLIKTSGRGTSWNAKLTPAGRAYLARVDTEDATADSARPGRIRYHYAVRTLRDRRDRHEVSRVSLPRALEFAQALVSEAQRRGWTVRPTSESENSYGMLDWTGPKDGHFELVVDGHAMRLRIHEEGVHARGLWEEQVARFADVAADSPLRQEAPLPSGQYDVGATGRLKLELCWGEWWTRQQTRWADTSVARLEDRLPEVLAEAERRAGAAAGFAPAVPAVRSAATADVAPPFSVPEPDIADATPLGAAPLGGGPLAGAPLAGGPFAFGESYPSGSAMDEGSPYAEASPVDLGIGPLDEHFGTVLDAESQRWEQAQRVRRYLDAMERAYGDQLETAEWIAWGRTYADRLDPLHGLKAPPRRPPEPLVPEQRRDSGV